VQPSALEVDITPLKRKPGSQKQFTVSLPPLDGMALVTAEVRATELHLDLALEVVGEELVAQGTIEVAWTGPCRRCLEEQTDITAIELREVFEKRPDEGETYLLAENEVDLEPMVRETVLLNLPVAPLCRDDCEGPDPSRFPTTVEAEADPEAEPPADPRWAALSDITFD